MLTWTNVLPRPKGIWFQYGLPLATLVIGGLSVAAGMEEASKVIRAYLSNKAAERRAKSMHEAERDRFLRYMPYLTQAEWRILAYLHQNRQRAFTAHIYGDLASTLYNQRFLTLLAPPGQRISILEATFSVTEPVWEVIEANSRHFDSPKVGKNHFGRPPWVSP